jgi:hypothetical protein
MIYYWIQTPLQGTILQLQRLWIWLRLLLKKKNQVSLIYDQGTRVRLVGVNPETARLVHERLGRQLVVIDDGRDTLITVAYTPGKPREGGVVPTDNRVHVRGEQQGWTALIPAEALREVRWCRWF